MPESLDPLVVTFLVNPLYFVGLGTFIGWRYLRTSSVWFAVIAHPSPHKLAGMVGGLVDRTPRLRRYQVCVCWCAGGQAGR